MAEIVKEYQMSAPVTAWLKEQGYEVYTEVAIFYRCADIVGRRGRELIIVELKLGFCQAAIHQLIALDMAAHRVYLAVARKPRTRSIQQVQEIHSGLLYVYDNQVEVLAEYEDDNVSRIWVDRLHERLDYYKPGGVAGYPNSAGEGPAIECLKKIKGFVRKYPRAGWDKIYRNVPNHYSSAKSMAHSMRSWKKFYLSDFREQLKREHE